MYVPNKTRRPNLRKKDNEMKISNLPKSLKVMVKKTDKSKDISRKGIYTYVVKRVINHL